MKHHISWRRWIIVGAAIFLLTLIALGHEGDAYGSRIRLIPFEEYVEAATCMVQGCNGARGWLAFVLIDGIGNLVVFITLGAALDNALMSILLPSRRITVIALLGAALSTAFEAAQLAIPGRVTAIDDVIINTTGTVLGAVFVIALRSHKRQARNVA